MKLKVIQEKPDLFFAEIVGVEGAYAQGDTPEKAVEYVLDVYKNIMEIKTELKIKTFNIHKLIKHIPTLFSDTSFKKFELAL